MPDVPLPLMTHNFPPPLNQQLDLTALGSQELDTDPVASPFPSKLAYDADSESEVPCKVSVLPIFGSRPCNNH